VCREPAVQQRCTATGVEIRQRGTLRSWRAPHSVVRLLSMPGEPGAYTDLVGRVPAFKRDGQPADDPGSRPPGRLATIVSRAKSGIQGAVSAITGIVTVVIIVIV